MKQFLAFISFSFFSWGVWAQDDAATIAKKINEIKKDTMFISAESVNAKWEEALETAKSLLGFNVEMWLKETRKMDLSKDSSFVMKSKQSSNQLQGRRGSLYRAFVYVNKNDIMQIKEGEDVIVVGRKNADLPAVNSKEEKSSSDELEKELQSLATPTAVEQVQPQAPSHQLSNDERIMLRFSKAQDFVNYLKQLKSEGRLAAIGKYQEKPSSGSYYLFVFNKDNEVVACLLYENGSLLNLRTLQADSFGNYEGKGWGARWFSVK